MPRNPGDEPKKTPHTNRCQRRTRTQVHRLPTAVLQSPKKGSHVRGTLLLQYMGRRGGPPPCALLCWVAAACVAVVGAPPLPPTASPTIDMIDVEAEAARVAARVREIDGLLRLAGGSGGPSAVAAGVAGGPAAAGAGAPSTGSPAPGIGGGLYLCAGAMVWCTVTRGRWAAPVTTLPHPGCVARSSHAPDALVARQVRVQELVLCV